MEIKRPLPGYDLVGMPIIKGNTLLVTKERINLS